MHASLSLSPVQFSNTLLIPWTAKIAPRQAMLSSPEVAAEEAAGAVMTGRMLACCCYSAHRRCCPAGCHLWACCCCCCSAHCRCCPAGCHCLARHLTDSRPVLSRGQLQHHLLDLQDNMAGNYPSVRQHTKSVRAGECTRQAFRMPSWDWGICHLSMPAKSRSCQTGS